MRKAVRAIIIKNDNILVIHRDKFGKIYYTLPGGGVEVGESLEQALYREIEEETSVEFTNPRLVYIEHSANIYGDQYVYLCNYVQGEPMLHPDSEENLVNKLGENIYTPQWLPIAELNNVPFLSAVLKQKLIDSCANGWSEEVEEITSTGNI